MIVDVSIVIPCYNHNKEILTALHSLTQLSPAPTAVIIIDDGSVTPVDVSAYSSLLPISLVRTENQGLAAARNTGLKRVNSQWVLFLDADDVLLPNALAHLGSMSGGLNADVICSGYSLKQGDSSKLIVPAFGEPIAALLQCNLGPFHSFVFNLHGAAENVLFDDSEQLIGGHEDYDYLCQIASKGGQFASIHHPTCVYIKHPGSMSSNMQNMLRTRLVVWSRFLLSLPTLSAASLLVSLQFLVRHYNDLIVWDSKQTELIVTKLCNCLSKTEIDSATLAYLIRSLPSNVREKIKESCVNEVPAVPVNTVQEVFDWRAHFAAKAIVQSRFLYCIEVACKANLTKIIIWGANELAKEILPAAEAIFDIEIVDSFRAGEYFGGHKIHDAGTFNFSENWPIFIASHSNFADIKTSAQRSGVEPERIF